MRKGTLRKRFYILFVARGEDGQLRKIPIPVHYAYVFVAGALIGVLGLTGIARSYMRMLLKTSQYNELRAEKDDLKTRYTKLEQVAKECDIQIASLGSLASEVSSLYGLKSDPDLVSAASPDKVEDGQVSSSMNRLYTLKDTALSGATAAGLTLGLTRNLTTADWVRANSAPNLWPVEGPVDRTNVPSLPLMAVRSMLPSTLCRLTFASDSGAPPGVRVYPNRTPHGDATRTEPSAPGPSSA